LNESNTANSNFGTFINAFRENNSKHDRINAITEDPNCIILAIENQKIKVFHSCKKFGGTRIKLNFNVAGLIGQGMKALLIVINPDKAIKTKEVTTPLVKMIWACKTSADLKNLRNASRKIPPPPAADKRTTRSQTTNLEENEDAATINDGNAAASLTAGATGVSTRAIKITPVFIPLPFLVVAARESVSHNPINLIITIKITTKYFNERLNGAAYYNTTENSTLPTHDATDGAKPFAKWLYAVHMNLIDETRISAQPYNMEIQMYAEERHRKCILPPLLSNTPHPIKELRRMRASSNSSSKLLIGTMRCAKKPTNLTCGIQIETGIQ
jgi:hypothetical protein